MTIIPMAMNMISMKAISLTMISRDQESLLTIFIFPSYPICYHSRSINNLIFMMIYFIMMTCRDHSPGYPLQSSDSCEHFLLSQPVSYNLVFSSYHSYLVLSYFPPAGDSFIFSCHLIILSYHLFFLIILSSYHIIFLIIMSVFSLLKFYHLSIIPIMLSFLSYQLPGKLSYSSKLASSFSKCFYPSQCLISS